MAVGQNFVDKNMRGNPRDIINQKFGMLTAIKFSHKIGGQHFWLFKCDCGVEKVIRKRSVVCPSADIVSCGCYNRKIVSEIHSGENNFNYVHGMTGTQFYKKWKGILARCYNPNMQNFPRYGGRGIKCLWESFKEFKNDMYESYLEHIRKYGEYETTIDRIDSNDDYYGNNCRWATWEEQRANRRVNKQLIYA